MAARTARADLLTGLEQEVGVMIRRIRRVIRERAHAVHPDLQSSSYLMLSWLAQLIAGRAAYNSEQLQQRSDPLGWADYALAPDFWNRTLQNWQSEFLAVGSMVVLSIYLRERGSPESKPVGEPHGSTGRSG